MSSGNGVFVPPEFDETMEQYTNTGSWQELAQKVQFFSDDDTHTPAA